MRLESWEQVGLEGKKTVAILLGVGAAFFASVAVAGGEVGLGAVSLVLGGMAAIGAIYLLSTAPKRSVRAAAFQQTLEAPSLAASSNIYLRSTSSRSKTLLMVRADEPRLKSFLGDVRRHVLLGYDGRSAVDEALPNQRVFSESVKAVLGSAIGIDRSRIEEGGDELDGILNSSGLDEETKLPLFIAVSFFLPIMLMLFAAMNRAGGLAEVLALVIIESVILDITLGISGSAAALDEGGKN